MILIVTFAEDIHALAVQRAVRSRNGCGCDIVEVNRIARRESISLRLRKETCSGFSITSEGKWVDLSEFRAVWLRRPYILQDSISNTDTSETSALIDNDCSGALQGLLLSAINGKWISRFDALMRASDKIFQLRAAACAGFRTPDTLVTQSRDEVLAFCKEHFSTGGAIIKTVAGNGSFLLTRKLTDPTVFSQEAYEAAPAIYQECVPGERHIRLLSFGDKALAASIDSKELDWRPNLNVPVSRWEVPDSVRRQAKEALDLLGLEMGVIDLKETPAGELVWLEVNPQGQFLFLEPLTGMTITEQFADYLIETSESLSVGMG
jgi:glutathione synthase/RimK-type ligase-like ATP-grasp enzyme